MNEYLTATFTHKRNSGSTISTIASNQACSPLDPVSQVPVENYPLSKLFLLRQMFTAYTALRANDIVEVSSVAYAVRAVRPWAAQGDLSAYYEVFVEQQLGS